MKMIGNICNAIVCIGLLIFGIALALACSDFWSGVLVFAIMLLAAIGHFLTQRIRHLVLLDGIFTVFSLIVCLAIAMR